MTICGLLAGALILAASLPYMVSSWRGTTRPNRASWWIFAVTDLLGTAASWIAGGRGTLIVPLLCGLASLAIALIAIRRGTGGWEPVDRVCIAIAAASLGVWWLTGEPLLAVAMNALADSAGHVPTLFKAWRDPRHEHLGAWSCFLLADLINLGQVTGWRLAEVLYPLALTANAVLVIGCCLLSPRRRAVPDRAA